MKINDTTQGRNESGKESYTSLSGFRLRRWTVLPHFQHSGELDIYWRFGLISALLYDWWKSDKDVP